MAFPRTLAISKRPRYVRKSCSQFTERESPIACYFIQDSDDWLSGLYRIFQREISLSLPSARVSVAEAGHDLIERWVVFSVGFYFDRG